MRSISELTKIWEERASRRREALRLRDEEHLTLEQIGQRLGGISKQRVWQLLNEMPGWQEDQPDAG